MAVKGNWLTIANQIQEKEAGKVITDRVKNLAERFQLITGNNIEAYREEGRFIVSLPLTPLTTP